VQSTPKRTAVVDLGSNTFRLVVFTAVPGSWWRRSDEIYDPMRIGAGMGEGGGLGAKRMKRALDTIDVYAHFCRASGLRPEDVRVVATSAIREASNGEEFVGRAEALTGLRIQVLSREEEARYGYVAAVNSTTLDHGAVLDLGGGSLQLVRVDDRLARESGSWRLGTVRMTEAFLSGEPATKKQLKALRTHAREELTGAPWLATSGERLVGIGGTVRNLAAAARHRAGLPSFGVQGFVLERGALAELTADLAAMTAAERGAVPGIKPERGDVILAGAATIEAVMDTGGFEAIEVTEEGLREGVFFETHLAPADPPLFVAVREASVRNLANQHYESLDHPGHVASLALQMFDALAAEGAHAGDPAERELLWAAGLLHDVGYTVDYDDHHKHSRYLILNAGLPGWTPREVALIAQMARYHRKGTPGFGELAPLMEDGDAERLARGAALLRVAEQLERSRDQAVRETRVEVHDGAVRLGLIAEEDASVARWAAQRHSELFESAFGRRLEVVSG
jgi:exopolyphosphatase/guanosine-5'-triphosphate,3'-diphosphate pyrophosphatase